MQSLVEQLAIRCHACLQTQTTDGSVSGKLVTLLDVNVSVTENTGDTRRETVHRGHFTCRYRGISPTL